MSNDGSSKQTGETDIAKLVEMAKKDIASSKAQYITFETGKKAELYRIRRWIIEHSPTWRSNGVEAIKKELKRLGIS